MTMPVPDVAQPEMEWHVILITNANAECNMLIVCLVMVIGPALGCAGSGGGLLRRLRDSGSLRIIFSKSQPGCHRRKFY